MLRWRIFNVYLSPKLLANLFAYVKAETNAACELVLVALKFSKYFEECGLIRLRDSYASVFYSAD